MKRYILFGGTEYYPLGGFQDFLGSYDSDTDAMSAWDAMQLILIKEPDPLEWGHVIDIQTMDMVFNRSEEEWREGGAEDRYQIWGDYEPFTPAKTNTDHDRAVKKHYINLTDKDEK